MKRRNVLLVLLLTGALSLVVVNMNLDLVTHVRVVQQTCTCQEVGQQQSEMNSTQQQSTKQLTTKPHTTTRVSQKDDTTVKKLLTNAPTSKTTMSAVSTRSSVVSYTTTTAKTTTVSKPPDHQHLNITKIWMSQRNKNFSEEMFDVLTFEDNSSFPSVRVSPYFSSNPIVPVTLSTVDYVIYMDMFRTVIDLFVQYGIEFIMADGTLLGSYLMHDILPWDDDIDIMVNIKHYKQLKLMYMKEQVFQKNLSVAGYHDVVDEYTKENMNETFTHDLFVHKGKRKKNYHKHKIFIPSNNRIRGPKKTLYAWQWPFVDVKFYETNNKEVKKVERTEHIKKHAHDTVYPIVWRPLGSLWAPAPHDSAEFLRKKYGKFQCQTQIYNHTTENFIAKKKRRNIPCVEFWYNYPHVDMEYKDAGSTMEHLVVGSDLVHTAVVEGQVQRKAFQPWTL